MLFEVFGIFFQEPHTFVNKKLEIEKTKYWFFKLEQKWA
jgi:hypothetical protein